MSVWKVYELRVFGRLLHAMPECKDNRVLCLGSRLSDKLVFRGIAGFSCLAHGTGCLMPLRYYDLICAGWHMQQ